VFLDQFSASFDTHPRHLTFDFDAVDDPAQNQYLPLVITYADNAQLVILSLRPGNIHAALGGDNDLASW
jgi:hypothetical protein